VSDTAIAELALPGTTGPASPGSGTTGPATMGPPWTRPASAGPLSALADWATMAGRCLRLSRRNVDALLTSLMLPVMIMLLFVYLFGGAIQTGTEYVTYVVPGVLLLCAGFGSSTTAVSVSHDMTGGIVDRFRSLDIGGAAVLAGHVAASVVRNAASTVLVFGIAFLIGFRPDAGALDWLAAGGILLAFVLAISWLSAAVGLLAKSPEAANGFTFFVMFLPYASSAFVPIHTMPSWIQGFAQHQPVTPVIETIRGLLLGTPVGSSPWQALAWCGGILAVSVTAARVLFRRRTT
jgi:ABC-2 type transport system permease protein